MSNNAKKEERLTKGKPSGYICAATRRANARKKESFEKAKTIKINKARKSKEELKILIHLDDEI